MRAAVVTGGEFRVTDLPDPAPGPGQVLVNVTRCGICGSDLHAREHCDEMAELFAAGGYDGFMRSQQPVVMGHEFTGEVIGYGSGTRRRWRTGTPVVAMPMLRRGRTPQATGLSVGAPGGFAEQMLVQESMTFPVPNGLSSDHAALTEPMAVAWHAVRKARMAKRETALVIGCGPVGLGVIAMLKAGGITTVVASDFSPRRRELAARCGADVVVDPGVESPWDADPKRPQSTDSAGDLNLAFDVMERLRRVPGAPWWYVFRAAHALNRGPKGPVVFECVGVPGILDRIFTDAPRATRVIVVGVCMQADTIHPFTAINKEIDLRFALGYDPGEFRDTLHMLADGKVDPTPLITGIVGLDGIERAFTALGPPNNTPRSSSIRTARERKSNRRPRELRGTWPFEHRSVMKSRYAFGDEPGGPRRAARPSGNRYPGRNREISRRGVSSTERRGARRNWLCGSRISRSG